jgi:hypothetical protein
MSVDGRHRGVSSEFSLRPSRRVTIVLAVIALFTLLYSLIVAGQILLWFILAGGAIGLYLIWLLIIAVFRLVEAVERIATAAEVDSGVRDPSEAAPGAPPRRTGGGTPANDTPDGPRAASDVSNRRDDTPAGDNSDGEAASEDSEDDAADAHSDGSSADDDSTHNPAPDDSPDRE